jgi:NADH-quinone oxidoreductase chain G
MNSSILVYVNDIPVYLKPSSTVIQACEKIGLTIPRFCYHDLLEIAGNCRICLVEIEKSPKPQVACGLPVLDQIRIYTNTPLVKKAREGVLEFLLLNHPLDCPICDQGGECDLQNQAIAYGSTRSRFYKFKRGVEDKGLGPIIKTVITRCIHCTRCIRFAWDVAGVEDLGISLRGNQSEVGTYLKKTFDSEVSGNIIDLCPVGALTSKVQAFKTRPWEIKSTPSIDISDCLGSNISIETKKSKPIRIVPKPNKTINLEWLSDKARFTYEGYISIRLAYPYFFQNNKYYKFSSYLKTQKSLENFIKSQYNLSLIFGKHLDLESLENGLNLSKLLGNDFVGESPVYIKARLPSYFQSTLSLEEIKDADSCILLGINPRIEATIANLRLRSRFKGGLFNVLNFGAVLDLTYPNLSLGLQINHLLNLTLGKHYNSKLKTFKPLLIYGDTLSIREDGHSSLILAHNFLKSKKNKNWTGCFRLPIGSNSIGKSFYGLTSNLKLFKSKILGCSYLLGTEKDQTIKNCSGNFILETTHINQNFKNASFVLPLQSVLEKDGSFINFNGTIQKSFSILRFGLKPLSYLQSFFNLNPKVKRKKNKVFNSISSQTLIKLGITRKNLKFYNSPLKIHCADMYRTDLCTSASLTLGRISANYRKTYWTFL